MAPGRCEVERFGGKRMEGGVDSAMGPAMLDYVRETGPSCGCAVGDDFPTVSTEVGRGMRKTIKATRADLLDGMIVERTSCAGGTQVQERSRTCAIQRGGSVSTLHAEALRGSLPYTWEYFTSMSRPSLVNVTW